MEPFDQDAAASAAILGIIVDGNARAFSRQYPSEGWH
jgi:hypothetical protein